MRVATYSTDIRESRLWKWIFSNRAAIIRLIRAVLTEQTDGWTEQRRYMGPEILAEARHHTIGNDSVDPTTAAIAA